MPTPYIGRFAPSPTGPLHLGSLLTALASYLDARSQQGMWLVRIEDLDPPREQAGASEDIITALKEHGLEHDGDIVFQSQRHARYLEVLQQLIAEDVVFPCRCSRQILSANNGIHSGRCIQEKVSISSPNHAWRAQCSDQHISFRDRLQGPQKQSLKDDVGDFVLLRKDGLFAYQLAVVVDDIDQQITHIVRGSDLLSSTARQIYLYQLLAKKPAEYCHLPLILNQQGQKLSKQNHAPALDLEKASENVFTCLELLGQCPPINLRDATCQTQLNWAIKNWNLGAAPVELPSAK